MEFQKCHIYSYCVPISERYCNTTIFPFQSGGGADVNGGSGGSEWKDSGSGGGGFGGRSAGELKAVQKELASKTAALADQVCTRSLTSFSGYFTG